MRQGSVLDPRRFKAQREFNIISQTIVDQRQPGAAPPSLIPGISSIPVEQFVSTRLSPLSIVSSLVVGLGFSL